MISTPRYAIKCISQRQAPCGDLRSDPARQPQLQWPWLSRASSNPALLTLLLTWEFCGANYTDSPPAAEFAMRLMKEPRGGLFSWCSYFSNYPLFLVPRVAVKRLQSKITQNTKKQTSSRKSRTGLHKTGARTEGGHGSPKRRDKPIMYLCQKLLSVDSETTMRVHDRRSPPARPLHHP